MMLSFMTHLKAGESFDSPASAAKTLTDSAGNRIHPLLQ